MDSNEFSEAMAAVTGQAGGVASLALRDGSRVRGFVKGVQFFNNQSFVEVIDFSTHQEKAIPLREIDGITPAP